MNPDQLSYPACSGAKRAVGQVCIAHGRLVLGVAQKPANHRKRLSRRDKERSEGVPKIVDSDPL
jgi:hypothetical protein